VTQVRVAIEYVGADTAMTMRWERQGAIGNCTAFELLGRAFEVALREEGKGIQEAMTAFFHGALLTREDVLELMGGSDPTVPK